jgi:predicted lipoprotein
LAAANATSQLRCFQAGPLLERDFTSVFSYWQILPPRVEAVINSSEALDRSLLDRLGATTKGLFAVEFLLFERGDLPPEERSKIPSVLELFAGTNSQRRAAFLLLVAHDVESKASQLAADWSARGDQAAATKFAAGGQDSLNLLVNQLSMGLEYIAEREVNFVLVLPQPLSLQLSRVERSRSGSSLRGALAGIEGARKIYLGGEGLGLDDSLQRLNAPLDQRIKDQFQATLAATSAIGSSLEQAAADHRATVEAAYAKLRELEVLIKVDLASALGVTITFSSNDGD